MSRFALDNHLTWCCAARRAEASASSLLHRRCDQPDLVGFRLGHPAQHGDRLERGLDTKRSRFGLARNLAAAAIGSAAAGPSPRARDSSTAARAVLTTCATMIGAVEWSSAAAWIKDRSSSSRGPL